jgi:hypothetical protein
MRIELINAEQEIMREIADPKMKRADIAATYAFLIRQQTQERPDWPKINGAIIERWSMAGLKWIKNRAWKLVLS